MLRLTALLALLPFVSLASAAAVEQLSLSSFDVAAHLGNLSPYQAAPVPSGIETSLPADCTVDQVMLMQRHGSRLPLASELVFIQGLAAKLANHSAAIQKAKLPGSMEFLKAGYQTKLSHDNLTAVGRNELFNHGVQFALKYPNLKPTTLLAGLQDRVVESGQWFANGYFGRDWAGLNATMFQTIPEDNVTISWITPMNTCKKWQYDYGNNQTIEWGDVYLPPITARLNKLLPGVKLTTDDVHGALYACAYDAAAYGLSASPWCSVFTASEIEDFEYELDLLMDGAFGWELPGSMGRVLGSLYISKLVDRFANKTGDADPAYIEFGHDTTIDMILTGLGLVKDTPSIPVKGPVRSSRKWRTTYQVPFAAQMVWEKFTCSSSFKGTQIRLVLNDAPMPLSVCKGVSKKYGSCSLDEFVASQAFARNITWGDATWNATCGNAGF